MCGLSGFVERDRSSSENRREVLEHMSAVLARRGPDEQSFFDDGHMALVFRRLSIIDLETGQQPIWNEDASIFVVVNGEIYNHESLRRELESAHRFRTRSDSEVVLHLYEEYGAACFERLNGMFAVAIYDRNRRQLVLARDRLGIKPLYVAEGAFGLLFGSELKALLMHPQCPRDIAWQQLEPPIVQQTFPVSSYVRGIAHVEAGTSVTYDERLHQTVHRYWALESHLPGETGAFDPEAFGNRYRALLEESVGMRLMSDVPVGLFLSGGIDSSLIATLAAARSRNLHCFTVVNRSTVNAGDALTAVRICRDLGLPLHAAELDIEALGKSFTLREFERCIALIESPRFDAEWYLKYQLHRFARQQVPDLKVVLLGQGADEFAGGYSRMDDERWDSWDEYLAQEVVPDLVQCSIAQSHAPERMRQLLNPVSDWSGAGRGPYHDKMLRFVNQLQHFNLWLEDRVSSFEGNESRVPFLDHRLVELLAGVPADRQPELFWNKAIVRKTLQQVCPQYPEGRPKVPFVATAQDHTLNRFYQDLALAVFPAFRMLYVDSGRCPFRAQELEHRFEGVQRQGAESLLSAFELIEMMAISVFAQFLQRPAILRELISEPGGPVPGRVPEDELEELSGRYGDEPPKEELQSGSRIRLVARSEVVTNIGHAGDQIDVFKLAGDRVVAKITIPASDQWALELLDKVARGPDQGHTVAELIDGISADQQLAVSGLQYLIVNGFVEIAA